MGEKSGMMENVTAPGVGDLVRIEHHLVGDELWDPVVLHWHDYCEFELVTSGEGIHTLNNRTILLGRGSAFLCMLDDFHTLKNDDGTIMELINFKFPESLIKPNVLKKLYAIANRRYCRFGEEQLRRLLPLISLFEEIQEAKYPDKDLKRELIESMLNQILILFLFQIPDENDSATGNREESRMQKAIIYIHKNFKENISVYDVAKHIDLSVNYFSTVFRRKTGQKFSSYLVDLRLNYARSLIEFKHMGKVSEIARLSGFYSDSYFIRAFKQKFGITPKEMIVKENQ